MENYDININWGQATIEVTLQQWQYKGHYRIKIRGNIQGFDILRTALDTFDLENEDIIWNDCNLDIFENYEGEGCFKAVLKDKEDNVLLTDDYLTELEDLIVGVKIIDYKEVKENGN